jgi:hypothetical protein
VKQKNNKKKKFILGRGGVGIPWGGDEGKKVPPRTGWAGDGGWGRDNGAGAGDMIPDPNLPHCHPYLCELRNFTNNLINHQNINHTQEHKYLCRKHFLLEVEKPRDQLRMNSLL